MSHQCFIAIPNTLIQAVILLGSIPAEAAMWLAVTPDSLN